jgi:quercetin dioxygenase-like cupin family protein
MKRMWPSVLVIAFVMAVVAIVLVANNEDDDRPGSTSTGGITRTPLGQASPANAPGQTLYLQRVTIAPHAKLAEHFHEGTQVARVTSGTLTYNIVSGTATITRGNGRSEEHSAPKRVLLHPDDWIIERAGLEHFGANDTDEPVVIELAALLEDGAPVATPVGTAAAGTRMRLTTTLTSQDRRLSTVGPNGSRVYGWNHLRGTATLDGQDVDVDMLGSVNYTSGNGPFSGFITFTFPGGGTLGVAMQGATKASADTKNAAFVATLGVIGGTGRFAELTGVGTFVGSRTAALGTAVAATFDLHLVGTDSRATARLDHPQRTVQPG